QFGVGSDKSLCDVPLPPKLHHKTYAARVLLDHARNRRAPQTEPNYYEAPDTTQCGFALAPEHAALDLMDDPRTREMPENWPGLSFPKFSVSEIPPTQQTPISEVPAKVTTVGPPATITTSAPSPAPAPLSSEAPAEITPISEPPAPLLTAAPSSAPASLPSDQAGGEDVDLRESAPPAGDLMVDSRINRVKRQSTDSVTPKRVTLATKRNRDSFSCGGAPITPHHILTAAHCIQEKVPPRVIRLGENDFQTDDESEAYDFDVKDITIHPGYKAPEKHDDIAIITLKQKITFGGLGGIQPYCLPSRVGRNIDNRNCTVSGWGTRPNTRASVVLKTLTVTVVPLATCGTLYASSPDIVAEQFPRGINDDMICAGVIADVCRGDSGGPLVFEENENDADSKEEQVGIVSSGYGCGDTRYPGIYTRIDGYLDWIDKVTMGDCGELDNQKN
ncbi:unnamed protein product, partial [Meganyctiphanes norvegica]